MKTASSLHGSTLLTSRSNGWASPHDVFPPRLWQAARRASVLLAVVVSLTGLRAQSTYTTPYTFTTLAGTALSNGHNDATGPAASFNFPFSVAVDGGGNVYVADSYNHVIRKITSGGVVSTIAGMAGTPGHADGTGTAATFNYPDGIAVDGAGNIYVADRGNNTIRLITSGGVVSTFAGTAGTSGTNDGQGAAARFNQPWGLASDGGGIYVADSGNHTIRQIGFGGYVTTLAGTPGVGGSADGTGSGAKFNTPFGVAADGSGNVYVADTGNNTVRMINISSRVVTTLAGTAGSAAVTDGTGNTARFNSPYGVAADGNGNVFVADQNGQTIRLISSGGVVSTIGGSAGVAGHADGTGSAASFNYPDGVAVDGNGNVYVADNANSTIRMGAPPTVVQSVLVTKQASFVQTSSSPAVIDPLPPGPGYGGPYGFNVEVQGTGLSGITAPAVTLPGASAYTPLSSSLTFSNNNHSWKFGSSGDGWSAASQPALDTGFAYGTYGLTVLGNSFSLNFADPSTYPPNTPAVTLSGGSWVGGKYVIDASQTLTITSNTFTNFDQNADGVMDLNFDGLNVGGTVFHSMNPSPKYVTQTIPGGTLAQGVDYAGRIGFYAVMDAQSVGGLPNSFNAAAAGWETRFVISAVATPAGGAKAHFYGVGTLAGNNGGVANSQVRDAVKTGGVIYAVGGSTVYPGSAANDTGFLWTSTGGLTPLPYLVQPTSPVGTVIIANALTPDAQYIASRAISNSNGGQRHAVRVTTSGLANLDLGTLPSFPQNSVATTISSDGSVMYGFARYVTPGKTRAVRFTAAGPTISAIPFLNGGDDNSTTAFHGESSDGSVMVGTSSNSANGGNLYTTGNQAFRYVQGTGVSAIPFLSGGTWSFGVSGSPDGNLALVAGNSPAFPSGALYVYDASGATTTLLGAPNGYGNPQNLAGMTSDGSVVAITFGTGNNSSFIHNNSGWHSLQTVLTRAGLSLPGWQLDGNNNGIVGLSADGTLLWGSGTHGAATEGWVIEFDPGYLAAFGALYDFAGDGNRDIIWQNTVTGERGFWLMNRTGFASWQSIGIVPAAWRIAGVGDFNGDGKPDIVWENTSTGERGFWLMNGTGFSSWQSIGIVSTDWHIAAVGDFNGDGNPDLLWENTVTGDRGFWLMNGTAFSSWQDIGVISPALKIVGTGDFNGDGKTDIVWENTSTGKRIIWLMNGTTFGSSVNLGIISTDWHIASIGDFNGDGKADLLWENTVTGERGFWLMNGTAFSSWQSIGVVSTDWRIAP